MGCSYRRWIGFQGKDENIAPLRYRNHASRSRFFFMAVDADDDDNSLAANV